MVSQPITGGVWMNLSYGMAGLIISLAGLLLFAISAPVLRYSVRFSESEPQLSPHLIKWLARGLGLILFILGLVTLLNN